VLIAYSLIYMLPLSAKIPFNWRELTPVAVVALDQFVLWDNVEGPKSVKEFILRRQGRQFAVSRLGGTGSKREDNVLTVFCRAEDRREIRFICPISPAARRRPSWSAIILRPNTNNSERKSRGLARRPGRALCVFDKERTPTPPR